ncbi:sigma factor G inhibitor Gin [Alkalihalobacillus oceani]|uniref:sigma factor G inhibitor Gin n=1 Tax=Halalkalibacter oceani TaxID=1653776 RepID=UPI002040F433|nr:sigma factor G inhibitor Gin [Halalkalibacter oceani]MCM3762611.1 sigma factor G inhibitor Gin [Halalkalibacter oceani]
MPVKKSMTIRLGDTCVLCKQQKEDGIQLCEVHVCEECEQKLVDVNVDDEVYPFYVVELRRLSLERFL